MTFDVIQGQRLQKNKVSASTVIYATISLLKCSVKWVQSSPLVLPLWTELLVNPVCWQKPAALHQLTSAKNGAQLI